MDSSRRDKAVSTVRDAGYAMGGRVRPAKGGPKISKQVMTPPMAPPPATPATNAIDGSSAGYADGGTTGGRRAWSAKNAPGGKSQNNQFASGGSVQGRARSAGKSGMGADVTPPPLGKDDDGDSSTRLSKSFKRGGTVK